MDFKAVVKKGPHFLRYVESLQVKEKGLSLILDFDSFSTDVPPSNYLATTDALHSLISAEYEKTIKGPVYKMMRKKVGGSQ
jgi:hypothetical protein